MRRAVFIVLTDVERQTLQSWARIRTLPARLVTRARIILLAGEGRQNSDIAAKPGLDRSVEARWRNRFAEDRLDGIAKERGNRGRKAHKRRRWARTIVEVTLQLRDTQTREEQARLERHPRFHLHFIPTSSSWLKLIERWFREITT